MANLRNIKPFKILGPGDQIRELMQVYNWTQEDLSSIIGISLKHINSILQNKQVISFEMAKLLSNVFGHSPQFWINLDTNYRLKIHENTKKENNVAVKSMLYRFMPINEMMKRNWITRTKDINELLNDIKNFWKTDIISREYFENMYSAFVMKKSEAYNYFNIQNAYTWLQKAKNSSSKKQVNNYNKGKLKKLSQKLHNYTIEKNGIEKFLIDIEQSGVKFIFLKHLPKTYLDGATFYDNDNPVIVYTGRYNRIDHFWFTIAHEIGHILLHLKKDDDVMIDDEKFKFNTKKIEKEANEFASGILKQKEIYDYFSKNMNYITKEQIKECSELLNIHQGIIIGALAFKKTISYVHLHKFTVKVNDKIPLRYFGE